MNDILDAFTFIANNKSLLLDKAVQQLWISALALAISIAIAVPLGVWLGHIHRGSFAAINISNIGRALPSHAGDDREHAGPDPERAAGAGFCSGPDPGCSGGSGRLMLGFQIEDRRF